MLLTSVGCPRVPKFKNLTFGQVRVLDDFFNRFIVGEHVVSQRIPHGYSKAGMVKPPLPSKPDLRLREWMNPPVDAYASVSGMIWSAINIHYSKCAVKDPLVGGKNKKGLPSSPLIIPK